MRANRSIHQRNALQVNFLLLATAESDTIGYASKTDCPLINSSSAILSNIDVRIDLTISPIYTSKSGLTESKMSFQLESIISSAMPLRNGPIFSYRVFCAKWVICN